MNNQPIVTSGYAKIGIVIVSYIIHPFHQVGVEFLRTLLGK